MVKRSCDFTGPLFVPLRLKMFPVGVQCSWCFGIHAILKTAFAISRWRLDQPWQPRVIQVKVRGPPWHIHYSFSFFFINSFLDRVALLMKGHDEVVFLDILLLLNPTAGSWIEILDHQDLSAFSRRGWLCLLFAVALWCVAEHRAQAAIFQGRLHFDLMNNRRMTRCHEHFFTFF